MKPLSERQLDFAKTILIDGRLRPFVKPIFHGALALEERWFTATAGPPRDLPPGKVTAVIKTFERPRRCTALIASIRRLYPDLPIIVVDDSREPRDYLGCRVIALPFDSGVSAGRKPRRRLPVRSANRA